MSGTRAISTTSRREFLSSFFFLQGKTPKKIDTILTETLACFLLGRVKGLTAPLYPCRIGDDSDDSDYNNSDDSAMTVNSEVGLL